MYACPSSNAIYFLSHLYAHVISYYTLSEPVGLGVLLLKCYYKTISVKYIFIVCDTILAAVHSSSWIRFDYYQSPL